MICTVTVRCAERLALPMVPYSIPACFAFMSRPEKVRQLFSRKSMYSNHDGRLLIPPVNYIPCLAVAPVHGPPNGHGRGQIRCSQSQVPLPHPCSCSLLITLLTLQP